MSKGLQAVHDLVVNLFRILHAVYALDDALFREVLDHRGGLLVEDVKPLANRVGLIVRTDEE